MIWKKKEPLNGLVVTGGGARGAYQVGVLKATSEILGPVKTPFPIISGVSVGALNAAGLASKPLRFQDSVENLEQFWRNLHTEKVFDPRLSKILWTGVKLIFATLVPRDISKAPKSLLDNSPLRKSLNENVDFDAIKAAINNKILHAVTVTCSGYDSGYAVTFFDTLMDDREWHRVRRAGHLRSIDMDEIMASSALPLLFPAIKIDNEYFGDGALRQTSPLAPAIHLGADRLFIIGTRDSEPDPHIPNTEETEYPSVGDIGGYSLDTIFHDSLEADIERMERLNDIITMLTPKERAKSKLKHIRVFSINPSKSLREIACEHGDEMPKRLRWILRRRSGEQSAGRIESYLLFEPGYVGELIDLGYSDAMARAEEIKEFFKT